MLVIPSPSLYDAQFNRQLPGLTETSSEIPSRKASPSSSNQKSPSEKDQVAISDQGKGLSTQNSSATDNTPGQTTQTGNQEKQAQNARDLEEIQQLKKRDADVRAHELAHLSVAGRYATGGMSFTYQTGPDGVRYAVGGEVPIDISNASTPEATIQKMEIVKRAALAPADPSSADRRIAMEATAKEMKAEEELQAQQRANIQSATSQSSSDSNEQNTAQQTTTEPSPVAANGLSSGNNRQIVIQAYQNMLSLA